MEGEEAHVPIEERQHPLTVVIAALNTQDPRPIYWMC